MTSDPFLDSEASEALYPPMVDALKVDVRRYRLAWLSASRRARKVRRDAPTTLPRWIALRGLGHYWTAHCLHEPCPAGFYAQGTRTHVEDQARQHIISSHGSTT